MRGQWQHCPLFLFPILYKMCKPRCGYIPTPELKCHKLHVNEIIHSQLMSNKTNIALTENAFNKK